MLSVRLTSQQHCHGYEAFPLMIWHLPGPSLGYSSCLVKNESLLQKPMKPRWQQLSSFGREECLSFFMLEIFQCSEVRKGMVNTQFRLNFFVKWWKNLTLCCKIWAKLLFFSKDQWMDLNARWLIQNSCMEIYLGEIDRLKKTVISNIYYFYVSEAFFTPLLDLK